MNSALLLEIGFHSFKFPFSFRKQETLKEPSHAPTSRDHEEDFMILEDDCPVRFTIPRKSEIKEKPAPESRSVEPDPKVKASPKQPKGAEKGKNEPKKKTTAKQSKANDLAVQDTAVESAPETRKPELNEDVGGGEQSSLSKDTRQDADIPGMFRKLENVDSYYIVFTANIFLSLVVTLYTDRHADRLKPYCLMRTARVFKGVFTLCSLNQIRVK